MLDDAIEMTPEEIVNDFYHAVEMYEGDLNDLRLRREGLGNPAYSQREQDAWAAKIQFNEDQLRRSIDRLLLMTNSLRVLAQRAQLRCPHLDGLAKSLSYKPYRSLPADPPTDQQLEDAADEAELVCAAHVGPAARAVETMTEASVSNAADESEIDEETVARLAASKQSILRALLRLGAVDAAHRVLQKQATAVFGHPHDAVNFRHEFSDLKRDGYVLPPKRSIGCWLSDKGRRAAEWLERHPQLG